MDIKPIQTTSEYDHSKLVNNPPFITNNPILEPIERVKEDFRNNELIMFRQQYFKEKNTNGIIWTLIIATVSAFVYCVNRLIKSIRTFFI